MEPDGSEQPYNEPYPQPGKSSTHQLILFPEGLC
jgi:hypothetical protein